MPSKVHETTLFYLSVNFNLLGLCRMITRTNIFYIFGCFLVLLNVWPQLLRSIAQCVSFPFSRSIRKKSVYLMKNMLTIYRNFFRKGQTKRQKFLRKRWKDCPIGIDCVIICVRMNYWTFLKLNFRWKNYVIRGIFTFIMIMVFCLIIYGGPLALMITVMVNNFYQIRRRYKNVFFLSLQTLLVQVKCFQEIISIGYQVYRIHGLPWFRSLSWYFLLTSNYFFYGENLVDYYSVVINRVQYLKFLVTYHRFLSFTLYCIGFVWFVLSLVKKYYMKQFSLFAWTHVALLIVVTQSYLIIQNIFEGISTKKLIAFSH